MLTDWFTQKAIGWSAIVRAQEPQARPTYSAYMRLELTCGLWVLLLEKNNWAIVVFRLGPLTAHSAHLRAMSHNAHLCDTRKSCQAALGTFTFGELHG